MERVCGICSHVHALAFALGVEKLAGVQAPPRAQAIRELVSELERIHSHLLWLGVAAHEGGFDTLFMFSWRDRETVMDLLETISDHIITGHCQGVDTDAAHHLLDALLQNPTARVETGPQRQIHHLQGLLYASENQAALALQHFQTAQRILPDIESGLVQAAVLAEHQFWNEALQHLQTLRTLLKQGTTRRSGKIDYPAEIEHLEHLINQDMQGAGTKP